MLQHESYQDAWRSPIFVLASSALLAKIAMQRWTSGRTAYRFYGDPFQLIYLEPGVQSYAYLTVSDLVRVGISIHCQVSARYQYSIRLLSLCWITGGHTVHPSIEGLLTPTGTELTLFRNSAPKVAGFQVHATILSDLAHDL